MKNSEMEKGFSIELVATIFEATYLDPKLISLFPREFQALLPRIDLSVFKNSVITPNDLITKLNLQLETRSKLMKYIYENQRMLTEKKEQQQFIGVISIQSFLAVIYDDISKIDADYIQYFVTFLVLSIDFVPNFSKEIHSTFLMFLSKITELPNVFSYISDVIVYISSVRFLSLPVLMQTIILLETILKKQLYTEKIQVLITFLNSLTKQIRTNSELKMPPEFLNPTINLIAQLARETTQRKLLDGLISFRCELLGVAPENQTYFIDMLYCCVNNIDMNSFTIEKYENIPPIETCLENLPDSVKTTVYLMSKCCLRTRLIMLNLLTQIEFKDFIMPSISYGFIHKLIYHDELPDVKIPFNFFFPAILYDPQYSMFDPKSSYVVNLRRFGFLLYKAIYKEISNSDIVKYFVNFMTNLASSPCLFTEILYYSTIIVNYRTLTEREIEPMMASIFAELNIDDESPYSKEMKKLELKIIKKICNMNNINSYIISSSSLSSGIVNLIFDLKYGRSLTNILAIFFRTNNSDTTTFMSALYDKLVKTEDFQILSNILNTLHSSLITIENKSFVKDFFQTETFRYIIGLFKPNMNPDILINALLMVSLAMKPSIRALSKYEIEMIANVIQSVGISLQIYTVLCMIISGSQTEFIGITNIDSYPFIKAIIKSDFKDDFMARITNLAKSNDIQKVQCIKCDLFSIIQEVSHSSVFQYIDLYELIAKKFTNTKMIRDYYNFYKDIKESDYSTLLNMTKNILNSNETSFVEESIFCFSPESLGINVKMNSDTFKIVTDIMLCSHHFQLFKIEAENKVISATITKDEFELVVDSSHYTSKITKENFEMSKWYKFEIVVNRLHEFTLLIENQVVSNLSANNFNDLSDFNMKLFEASPRNDTFGTTQETNFTGPISVYSFDKLLYHFSSDRNIDGEKLLNTVSSEYEFVQIRPNLICNVNSFKKNLLNTNGVEFFLLMSQYCPENLLVDVIEILVILISKNVEIQRYMHKIKFFRAFAATLDKVSMPTIPLYDSLIKLESEILVKSLKYDFHKYVFVGTQLWFKDKNSASVLLQKWSVLQDEDKRTFAKLIPVERIIYYITRSDLFNGNSHTLLLSILRQYVYINIDEKLLQILFRFLENYKDDKDVSMQVLQVFFALAHRDPKASNRVKHFILGSRSLLSSSQPYVIYSIIMLFIQNEEPYASRLLWFFMNETRFRSQELNEEFALEFCNYFIGAKKVQPISEITRLKKFSSIASPLFPFICILGSYVSEEMRNEMQVFIDNILADTEICVKIAKTLKPLSLAVVSAFLLMFNHNHTVTFVNLIKQNTDLLGDCLKFLELMNDYIKLDVHLIANTLLSAMTMRVFSNGTPHDKNSFVSIVSNYLLRTKHVDLVDQQTEENENAKDIGSLLDFILKNRQKQNYSDGPKLVDGDWEDMNVATILLDNVNDNDLSPESYDLFVILLSYVLRAERNSNSKHSHLLDALFQKLPMSKSYSILFPECAIQQESCEADAPMFYKAFQIDIANNLYTIEKKNETLEAFFKDLKPFSNIEDVLVEFMLTPVEYVCIDCPLMPNLLSFMDKFFVMQSYKRQHTFEKIQESFTYEDSGFVFVMKMEDKYTRRHLFDSMLRPYLYTKKVIQTPPPIIKLNDSDRYFMKKFDAKNYSFFQACKLICDDGEKDVFCFIDNGHFIVRSEVIVFYKFDFRDILSITWEWWRHHPNCMSIYLKSRKAFLLKFPEEHNHRFVNFIADHIPVDNQVFLYYDSVPYEMLMKLKLTLRWKRRMISTYEYIHWLNIISGRSFLNRENYPIFPWLYSSYNEEMTPRNLSRNINCVNKAKVDRLKENEYMSVFEKDNAVLYKNNYISNPRSVQDSIFETGLKSINEVYKKLVTDSGKFIQPRKTNEDEEIPEIEGDFDAYESVEEYFYCVDNLKNIEVPKWCTDASDFVNKNRILLEQDDNNIEKWIDMVFGISQQGTSATIKSNTYSYKIFTNAFEDRSDDIEEVMGEQGNAPQQLFDSFHPARNPQTKGIPRQIVRLDIQNINYQFLFRGMVYCFTPNCVQGIEYSTIKTTVMHKISPACTIRHIPSTKAMISFFNRCDDFFTIFGIDDRTYTVCEKIGHVCSIHGDKSMIYCGLENGSVKEINKENRVSKSVSISSYSILDIYCCLFNNIIIAVDSENTVFFMTSHNMRVFRTFKVNHNVDEKIMKITYLQTSCLFVFCFTKSLITMTCSGELVRDTYDERFSNALDFCFYKNNNFDELIVASMNDGKIVIIDPITHCDKATITTLRIPCSQIMFNVDYEAFICSCSDYTVIVPDRNITSGQLSQSQNRFVL